MDKQYLIQDEQGNTYYLGPSLFEAEVILTRCLNEDIDAYLVDAWEKITLPQ